VADKADAPGAPPSDHHVRTQRGGCLGRHPRSASAPPCADTERAAGKADAPGTLPSDHYHVGFLLQQEMQCSCSMHTRQQACCKGAAGGVVGWVLGQTHSHAYNGCTSLKTHEAAPPNILTRPLRRLPTGNLASTLRSSRPGRTSCIHHPALPAVIAQQNMAAYQRPRMQPCHHAAGVSQSVPQQATLPRLPPLQAWAENTLLSKCCLIGSRAMPCTSGGCPWCCMGMASKHPSGALP
jgi:hypothetical protein